MQNPREVQPKGHIREAQTINAPVTITDIIVSQKKGMGEFNTPTSPYDGKVSNVQRISDHIAFLADIANKQHELDNFQRNDTSGKLELKNVNNVTRLSLNEFSLYTANKPLTMDEFKELNEKIVELASNLQDNLHLALGSIPVLGPDNQVFNMVIYAQCGENAEIKSFAKSVPSDIDAVYPGTSNPSFVGAGSRPYFLGRGNSKWDKTNSKWVPYTYDKIVIDMEKQFNIMKDTTNDLTTLRAAYKELTDWVNTSHTKLNAIKDPNYPVPQTLLDAVNTMKTKLAAANTFEKVRLLQTEFDTLMTEMKSYKTVSDQKFNDFKDQTKEQENYGRIKLGNNFNVNNSSSIVGKTKGGAKFWVGIDVCLDHAYQLAEKSLEAEQRKSIGEKPIHGSHMELSDSMSYKPVNISKFKGGKTAHADIKTEVMGVKDTKTGQIEPTVAMSGDPTTMKPTNTGVYTQTKITKTSEGLSLEKPPFGPDCEMRKYPSHQLAPLALKSGEETKVDSYISSYYINRSKIVIDIAKRELPDKGAEKQLAAIEAFNKSFDDLIKTKGENNIVGNDIIKCVTDFKAVISEIKDENTTKLLDQIGKLEHFHKVKMRPPEQVQEEVQNKENVQPRPLIERVKENRQKEDLSVAIVPYVPPQRSL